MNTKMTLDQRFLDAQIALIMEIPDEELDEMLEAVGLDPIDIASRGTAAIGRALVNIKQTHHVSTAVSSLPINRQREVAKSLGIRRSVFTALIERRALIKTIPKRLLKKLAGILETTVEAIELTLSGPLLPTSAQHKSDQAPVLPKQVSFEQLLREASMTEVEIAELMRDDA